MNALDPNHKPDYTNTHPPFDIPPQPSWFDKDKIVSLDPWGHMAQTIFKSVRSVAHAPLTACLLLTLSCLGDRCRGRHQTHHILHQSAHQDVGTRPRQHCRLASGGWQDCYQVPAAPFHAR